MEGWETYLVLVPDWAFGKVKQVRMDYGEDYMKEYGETLMCHINSESSLEIKLRALDIRKAVIEKNMKHLEDRGADYSGHYYNYQVKLAMIEKAIEIVKSDSFMASL